MLAFLRSFLALPFLAMAMKGRGVSFCIGGK